MALPRTFNFTAADTTDIVSYDAAFAYSGSGLNSLQIISNQLFGIGASIWNMAVVNGETFNTDQYAEARITTQTNGRQKAVCARLDNLGNGYAWIGSDQYTTSMLAVMTLRTPVQIGSAGTAFHLNDVIRIEVTGTSIVGKINGSTDVTTTDSTYSSGKAGIGLYGSGGGTALDDFTVDSINSSVNNTVSASALTSIYNLQTVIVSATIFGVQSYVTIRL